MFNLYIFDILRKKMEFKFIRMFIEIIGSGVNKVMKIVVEEIIIKVDGLKVINWKEMIICGEQGGVSVFGLMMLERGREKEKDDKKDKGSGVLGVGICFWICQVYILVIFLCS